MRFPYPSSSRSGNGAAGASLRTDLEPDVACNLHLTDGRVVTVLDDLYTSASSTSQVRVAAAEFIEQHLQPSDLATVFHTSEKMNQQKQRKKRLLPNSWSQRKGGASSTDSIISPSWLLYVPLDSLRLAPSWGSTVLTEPESLGALAADKLARLRHAASRAPL